MQYVAKLLGLEELGNTRKEQIIRQTELDKKLAELCKVCPINVSRYLLAHRAISRQQQEEIIATPVLDFTEASKKQLAQNHGFYDALEVVLKHKCPCHQLRELAKKDKTLLVKKEDKEVIKNETE